MSAPAAKARKHFYTTVNVDVDIDVSVLEDNGFHHEDECPNADESDFTKDRRELSDWHDKAHGLTLWQSCPYEPCTILSLDYRSTP